MNLKPEINIIVPLYNEEKVFNKLVERLTNLLNSVEINISVIMVDDGSSDSTPDLMKKISINDKRFQSIILSRNFGHQIALTAGLSFVEATDAVLIIDGDLQDPPELITNFYEKIKEGYDVVYAVRKKRKESVIKRVLYSIFYKILRKISYIEIPLDSGDFSMISRRVTDHLNAMPEESRYLRGMRSWIGFRQIGMEYERFERADGHSKYTFIKLLKLALNGIFNFSEFPIKAILNSGIIVTFFSMIYVVFTFIKKIFFLDVPQGFTTIITLITLFGGLQLIAIGIIGEYILRIFFQVKGRPNFIVKEIIKN